MSIDQASNILITASNDSTIGFHRIGKDSIIEETLLRLGIEGKLNDIAIKNANEIYTAGVNG